MILFSLDMEKCILYALSASHSTNGGFISTNPDSEEEIDSCSVVLTNEAAMMENQRWRKKYLGYMIVLLFKSVVNSKQFLKHCISSKTINRIFSLSLRETTIELANPMRTAKERVDVNIVCHPDSKTMTFETFDSRPTPSRRVDFEFLEIGCMHFGPIIDSTHQKDNLFLFTRYSANFENNIPCLHSKLYEDFRRRPDYVHGSQEETVQKIIRAGCYLDSVIGPGINMTKDNERMLLSQNKNWPFLLRFPIGCFGISLGLGSQTILWKTLATTSSMNFLHVTPNINIILWCLAVVTLFTIFTIYSLKCVFYFEAVRREYHHPVRINFFFAPWIAGMFLTLGVPPAITTSVHPMLWCAFMVPVFLLELKIYGQWLSRGKRRLSKVANPSTHLSLVGNFVGALLASKVGWNEIAIFFWAVGLAHYLVLFVTLYQRLPSAEVVPRELHPVYFLFVAAPSTASVAWENIVGDFDFVSRIAYFVGLFLYLSLVVRLNFFCGFRFSIAWWAYTFPMTASGIAAVRYSQKVTHPVTQGLAVLLCCISAFVVLLLVLSTMFHAFFHLTIFHHDVTIPVAQQDSTV